MKVLNHRFTLEMTELHSQATVHIKKYDTKNKLVISLTENGKIYTIAEGTSAAFIGKKADGSIVLNDCDIVGNTIEHTLTAQTSAEAGIVASEIRLYDANKNLLTSPRFTVVVDEVVLSDEDEDKIISGDEFNALTNAMSEVQVLVDDIETKLENGEFDGEDGVGISRFEVKQNNLAGGESSIDIQTSDGNTYSLKVKNGIDGVSPTISETDIEGGYRVAITGANGTKTLDLMHGVDGNADGLVTMKDEYGNNLLYLTRDGEIIGEGVVIPQGGGGGGGGGSVNNAVLTATNTAGWLTKAVAEGADCNVSFTWSSLEDGIPTGNGILSLHVNGTLKFTREVEQGAVSFDLSEYLSAGNNTARVSVADVYGNARPINYSVNVVTLNLTSTFDEGVAYTDEINFTYTPNGNVEKKVEFWLDGAKIGENTVTTSGRQASYTIPAQAHGAHRLDVFCTATIGGETVESNHLYYEFIAIEDGNTTPIIASSFRNNDVKQYDTIQIPYRVYDPRNLIATITQTDGEGKTITLTADRTEQKWSYFVSDIGTINLKISCGDVHKIFELKATENNIQVEAETEALALYLTSYGRSNNEDNPNVWKHGNISAEFSNFNFVSDGWHLDDEGVTVLRVAGDARLTIPYKIFANDFRTTGKTIEIEFATRDVLNYDAVLLSCMSVGRGLEVTTQKAVLKSEQSTIGTQYKEEEHVRLSFVVEKRANNKLILCYINGILSGTVQYPDADDFSQTSPADITIGSNDCTTDIYNIRVYDNDLTRHQILDNWIADTKIASVLKNRFERNHVYDEYGQITIATNKRDLPYLVINSAVLPQYKGDKKTCSGYYVDPEDDTKSFTFSGAEIDVQGTSSQYYYVKNYKLKFKGGFKQNGETSVTYQLNENVIPTDTFTFKADVASSEGANNVVLAQLYNELCPVKTPPQEVDARVRQTIDGLPIVVFWDNGGGAKFIGKYNFNHDKGTEEVFGFESGDESWEILQNGTDRVGWKSADFTGNGWKNDFEARYPEDNVDTSRLAVLAEWLVSTNTEAATNASLPEAVTYDGVEYTSDTAEYRLAKFKHELPYYASVDALVFYYVFTELFLCIDQREKNAFPTRFEDMGKWLMFFYDADSSLGIDNKGNLAFDYYLEDIDYTEAGDPVFNGQGSVLWVNLRNAFYDKITDEYKRLRTTVRNDGSGNPLISYDVVNNLFEAHQSKWSEAIYNEDGYRKCIEPLVQAKDAFYLPMLQGKKEQQRKWWLYNRFRYLDSKYVTGSSMETRITIRAHAKANITLTAYVNMYGHVYYNAEMVEKRMFRGQEYDFEWGASGAEDPVIGINDADMLTSIGDLSPLMVEMLDISKATHLTSLKVGDAADGYVNNNLNSITFGNNVLMKTIDLRNCASLTQAVDVSGCTGLEEAYFDGTAITGLTLPNGGNLKKLHLPNTITSLILQNQTALTEFVVPSYSNVTTLRLENNSDIIDPLAILSQIPANSRVRLVGFDWSFDSASDIVDLCDRLDLMRGLDENGNNTDKAQVGGTVRVENILSDQLISIQTRYPSINVVYDNLAVIVNFYDATGEILLQTVEAAENASVTYTGEALTKESTAQYEYTFAGWSKTIGGAADPDILDNIGLGGNFYAVFTATVRTYTVYFYNGDTLLQAVIVPYGSDAFYTGDTPVSSEDASYEFLGWDKDTTNITGDLDCYALFKEPIPLDYYSWDGISAISAEGRAANYFAVGDTKAVAINGTVGTVTLNDTYYVYILGFDHNSEIEGTGITFGTFKTAQSDGVDICLVDDKINTQAPSGAYFNMKHSATVSNDGGWQGCDMRYDILGSVDVFNAQNAGENTAINPVANTLMAALPADLRAVMKPITKYTDNTGGFGDTADKVTTTVDYLPLLAEFEVFGVRTYANSYEQNYQQQYTYYAVGNNPTKYRHSDFATGALYWGRSSSYDPSGVGSKYCSIFTRSYGSYFSTYSYGVSPIFLV